MVDLDLSPPEGLTVSLWRSLLLNFIDHVAPQRLPPLELTSKPVDVGLLAGDLLELPWYRTIFSNLADVISPDILPPLQLDSRPVAAFGADASLQILDWSSLISTPKIFLPDAPKESSPVGSFQPVASPAPVSAPVVPGLLAARIQLARDLGRTRFRRKIWIGFAAAEAVFLLVALFKFV